MSDGLVSIVLLNWNGEQHVHRCMQHIVFQDHSPIEIIIVDNGSTDGSLQKLKATYPQAIYLENSVNRGYSAGMNQGIAAAQGAFIIPLNQDTCLAANFVSECLAAMAQDATVGVIGGRVHSWIGDELTSTLRKGEGERTALRKRFQGLGGDPLDAPAFVFNPSGSYPFFRRETLEDIKKTSGYWFDERFETGWEDLDLAFRLHLLGWKCLFLPTAVGWHVGSGSVGGKSTFYGKKTDYQTRVLRNRLYTIYKNLPRSTFLHLMPYMAITELGMLPMFLFRSPRSIKAWISAWAQFVHELPQLRKKRRRIQQNIRIAPEELKRYFVKF